VEAGAGVVVGLSLLSRTASLYRFVNFCRLRSLSFSMFELCVRPGDGGGKVVGGGPWVVFGLCIAGDLFGDCICNLRFMSLPRRFWRSFFICCARFLRGDVLVDGNGGGLSVFAVVGGLMSVVGAVMSRLVVVVAVVVSGVVVGVVLSRFIFAVVVVIVGGVVVDGSVVSPALVMVVLVVLGVSGASIAEMLLAFAAAAGVVFALVLVLMLLVSLVVLLVVLVALFVALLLVALLLLVVVGHGNCSSS